LSGEFDIIARCFAPLSASSPDALALKDDVAFLASEGLAITKDLLVEGVHFRAKDPRDLVARKALRVNLSDLAGKGAKPFGYFLGCVWPMAVKEDSIESFARGLGEDQDLFKVALLGGDTTAHRENSAPLIISVTMLGRAQDRITRRNGASIGDDVYVSGTIGDAGLALLVLENALKVSAADKKALVERYQLPVPRLSLGGAILGLATASIDISDGLLADARHIASESSVAIEITAEKIPLSPAAARWLDGEKDRNAAIARLASSGDDYEIFFTASAARRRSIEMAAQVTRTPVARIGSVVKGDGVRLIDVSGALIKTPQLGYDHFKD
jgi:thiamine-monophosphate kinase